MGENKEMKTNEELINQLKTLRNQEFMFKIMFYGCGFLFLFMCLKHKIAWSIACLVGLFFLAIKWQGTSNKIKEVLSENIVRSVVTEALGDTTEYHPGGTVRPGSMVFPFTYNTYQGSDHIKTVYHGLNIEISDVELIEESETTDENGVTEKNRATRFKGQWLICDFGKELAAEVYVSEWDKRDRIIMKSNVFMDNEQFGKRFCVRTDNPQEAFYILTPHMMEYITKMSDKCGGIVYLSFLREGKIQIAVKTGRDFFELRKDKPDVNKLRQRFFDELRWFTDIVDTLRVEETIYKQADSE